RRPRRARSLRGSSSGERSVTAATAGARFSLYPRRALFADPHRASVLSFYARGERSMIARTWHGRVPAAKADAYHQYLLRTGVAGYAGTPGNRGVHVLRRMEGEVAHFLLITYWDSV